MKAKFALAALAGLVVGLSSFTAWAACPSFHRFQDGDTARAKDVLDNFDYILCGPTFSGPVGIYSSPNTTGAVLSVTPTGWNWNEGIEINPSSANRYSGVYFRTTPNSIAQSWTIAKGNEGDTAGSNSLMVARNGLDSMVGTGRVDAPFVITMDGTTRFGGNVGVGEAAPLSPLTVRRDISGGRGGEISIVNYTTTTGSESALNFAVDASTYNGDQSNAQIKARNMSSSNNNTDLVFSTWSGSSFNENMRIQGATGNVGIGTPSPGYLLDVNGTIRANNVSPSDRRLKKDIKPLVLGALDTVEKLQPVTYRWMTPKDDGMRGVQIGFIAQDVERILPNSVLTSNDKAKTKSVKYNELLAVLVKAVQEENAVIKRQQRQLTDLRTQNDKLARENENLSRLTRQISTRIDRLERAKVAMGDGS